MIRSLRLARIWFPLSAQAQHTMEAFGGTGKQQSIAQRRFIVFAVDCR